MKRMLITFCLIMPGSIGLAYAAPDIHFGAHLAVVCALFVGGMIDARLNW